MQPFQRISSGSATGPVIAVLDRFDDALVAVLDEAMPAGWSCVHAVAGDVESRTKVLADADVAFAMWGAVTEDMLAPAARLRLIQKLGAGVDRIDVDACRRRGIAVAKLTGVNAVPVAEHVVLLMLAALRRLPATDRRVRDGEWFKEEARGFQRELRAKIVGLVGVGQVGREVARRLRGFEAIVVYYDVRRLPPELERELGLTFVDLDRLVAESDIVSLHVPLSSGTEHLIDASRLQQMKDGAIVVNCARGGLVDEAALAAALVEGRIGGAGLDTFETEPPAASELFGLDTVVVTPHSAGATRDNFSHVVDRAIDNVRRHLAGESLPPGDSVVGVNDVGPGP